MCIIFVVRSQYVLRLASLLSAAAFWEVPLYIVVHFQRSKQLSPRILVQIVFPLGHASFISPRASSRSSSSVISNRAATSDSVNSEDLALYVCLLLVTVFLIVMQFQLEVGWVLYYCMWRKV